MGVKKPKGLACARNKGDYYFGWKNTKTYDSLQLQYKINNGKWSKSTSLKKKTTSRKVSLGVQQKVKFRVRGKIGKKYSNWAESKEYKMLVPNNPTVTAELTSPNVTKFKAVVAVDETSWRNLQYIHWETILVKDCNTTDHTKISWKGAESGNYTKNGTHEYSIQEQGWSQESYSYTRWYRAYAHGVAGSTGWYAEKHVYATPLQTTNVTARYELNTGTGATVVVDWDSPNSTARPIDTVTVEYLAAKPECTVREIDGKMVMTLSCPNTESGWTALKDVSGVGGHRAMSFNMPSELEEDQCLFIRVNNKHDENTTYGVKTLVSGAMAKLKEPSISEITPGQNNVYTVKVNRGTEINEAFIGVYLRTEDDPDLNALIGIIPANQNQIDVVVPSDIVTGIDFGVKAYVANYTPVDAPIPPNPTYYTVTNIANVGRMESVTNWKGGSVPLPPVEISLLKTSNSSVQIGWEWSWKAANKAEISWADHEDAWESTNEPQTYTVNSSNSSRWNIAGLGVGTWYIRLRLLRAIGETTIYGTYSDIHSIKLSESPDTPSLLLSDGVITKTGFVTCYWVYVSGDGTAQMQGEICEAFLEYAEVENPSGDPFEQLYYEKVEKETMDVYVRSYDTVVDLEKTYYTPTGNVSYSDPIGSTVTSQHITISAETQKWDSGETHHLAARVFSASGESSNGWSSPVPVTIADEIHAEIIEHSLEQIEIPIDVQEGEPPASRIVLSLTEFPLTCTTTGAGKGGVTTYIIERAESYSMERPTGIDHEGFEGETIAKAVVNENDQVVITQEDLIGMLDDGASYRLIATVKDTYGQSDTTSIEFEVHWEHQAIMPSADLSADWEEFVTYITPVKPEGWLEGDVCDVYRLSADRPELIIQNGAFDIEYVDPYPTLGKFGGYRIVYKTVNGDYITEDNIPAWVDYTVEDDPDLIHNVFGIIIDFDGETLELPYNVSVSNSWKKGFTMTKYLGGSIQGDWDPGVERSSSANTTIPVEVTPDKIEAIRRLATYSGICHVRTPDGSSYSANIEVKDDREEKWTTTVSKVSLDITRIDSERFDGLPYNEWIGE